MPDIVDFFSQNPFSWVNMTTWFQRITPRPTLLGALGTDLFRPIPSNTDKVAIGQGTDNKRLVSVSAIGSAPVELEFIGTSARTFRTHRLAKGSTLYEYQLQGVLQQPQFQAVQTAQAEMARRAALIRDDIELTFEYHRLGCVLGKVLDADGVSIVDDWFDAWGVTPPAPVYFDFAAATTDTDDLRLICRQIIRRVKNAAPEMWIEGVSRVHALCGDDFYKALITNKQVREVLIAAQARAELMGAFEVTFQFGGIIWHDWNADLDNRFGVTGDEARFFPSGMSDLFQHVKGPAEFPPWINQPGQDTVSISFGDLQRRAWQRFEMYTYPLFICTRPEVLLVGKKGAKP